MVKDGKIRISTVRRDRHYKKKPHLHSDNELYFLEEGKSKLFVDSKLYNLSEGSLAFIKCGRIHKISAGNNTSHVRTVLMFPDSVISEILKHSDSELSFENLDSVVIHVPETMQNQVKQIFREIETEIIAPDCMSDIMIHSNISYLLISMLRQYSKQSYEYRLYQDTLDEVIRKAINYIQMNYSADINLNEMAKYVSMSPTYFSKKFKRETGIGFKEYVCRFRLNQAAQMLKNPDFVSVTDVALKCGFSNSTYFATAFKTEYGMSPNRFKYLSGI